MRLTTAARYIGGLGTTVLLSGQSGLKGVGADSFKDFDVPDMIWLRTGKQSLSDPKHAN
jgi:hypothetical protein